MKRLRFTMRLAYPRHQRNRLYPVLVAALGIMYGLFYCLSSVCFATGLFHLHDAPDAHQHAHETEHTATMLDICDFTLQMLSTTDLTPAELPVSDLTFYKTTCEVLPLPPSSLRLSQPAIRAPPVVFS